MIRILLGSALPVLGIGAAATFLSPDLLTAPRGEPLVMVVPGDATLQPANYAGDACASTLLFADPSGETHAPMPSGARIVVFALRRARMMMRAVEDFPRAPAPPRTVVLIFDESGRLVSAGDSTSLDIQSAAGLADCINPPAPNVHAPI